MSILLDWKKYLF